MKTLFQCEPAYEVALREAGLLNFDTLMQVKGGPAASSHAHRETIPLDIAIDGRLKKFYLKRVFRVPPKHSLLPLLRGRSNWSQPRKEWEILGRLSECDIPAMKRVAYGERRRLGMPIQAALLVEAVPMASTLENWLVPGFSRPFELSAAQRHRLTHDLGQQLYRLHGSGFRWPDIQPKHIFAEPTSGDRSGRYWNFCLIDVERMEHASSLMNPAVNIAELNLPNDESAFKDLKKFFRGFSPLDITPRDIRRFWAGYCFVLRKAYRRQNDTTTHAQLPMPTLIKLSPLPRLPDDYEHPRAVPLRRLKRMLIDARVAPYLSQLGWQHMSDVFAYQGGRDLSKPGLLSYRERIRIQFPKSNGRAEAYYLKRYDHPPLAEQLRRIREFRPTRSSAAREMHFIKRLAQIGVPTLRPIAFGQEMTGIWERRSFGLTAELDGHSLEKLIDRWASDPKCLAPFRERREIIRQLGLLVRLLHDHNLFHRDLYLAHIFLTRNADSQIVLRLIDLARMIEDPWNPKRWAIKDLAALAYFNPSSPVTRTDRIRFLYYYLGDRSTDKMKRLIRRYVDGIEAKVRRIARHDRRRTTYLAGRASA